MLSVTSFAALLNADKKLEINIYEKPDITSKVTASLHNDTPLIQIFNTNNKDWIKVANPQNGDTGWVQTNKATGPIVTAKIDGSKIYLQIINNKNQQSQTYSVVQYSSSNIPSPEETKKTILKMEKSHKKMRSSILKMQEDMEKVFKDFDHEFYQLHKN